MFMKPHTHWWEGREQTSEQYENQRRGSSTVKENYCHPNIVTQSQFFKKEKPRVLKSSVLEENREQNIV